ncbi:I-kappaB kinase epsilon [Choristoneura fumiferana]|uniref:I-kappaB kinase epsilon n=1 Tax=Choristoneura fumiferana TaxID=7141 RepID=UPI003D156A22
MSFLRGSENYVWCTTSVLGKGATGAVFQGVNKNNGEPVAVKTFNQLSHMRPHDVQMREFEVLRKVKHENIVKLLAIEEEQEGRGKVIVMELCTGGSLFNILDDPENTYGLQEQEFLLVLEHLTAGMKHLRDNNLVHRDLKPGNIMKFINEDGRTTYKLTDFGAARELQEEEQFVSLYGTEEYLHPDMYERAVLRKPCGKSFGATVDLWSIGVTLYHVATGQLPFRPYGGRRNKETMFYITTKKASGVIAGTQTTENGPIDWARDLPSHCQLSVGLRKLVTPLLAGLLEVDPHRIWTFERFFSEVQAATSTIAVHVFHVNKACSIKVFLKPEDRYEQLQTALLEQCGVVAESQVLLHADRLLLSEVEERSPARQYPGSSATEPLLLFNKSSTSVALAPEPDPPKFPVFPNIVSVENDASQAKTACSVGHVIKRRVEALAAASALCGAAVERWGALLAARLAALVQRTDALHKHALSTRDAARALDLVAQMSNAQNGAGGATTPEWSAMAGLVAREAGALRTAAAALAARHGAGAGAGAGGGMRGAGLRGEWEAAARAAPCVHEQRLHLRARTLIERLRESWQHLVRDRATRALTYNDEQFHVLERITVGEAGRRARALLLRAAPMARARADALHDWYQVAQTVWLQTCILDKDAAGAELKLLALAARLQDAELHARHQLQDQVSTPYTRTGMYTSIYLFYFIYLSTCDDDHGLSIWQSLFQHFYYSVICSCMSNAQNGAGGATTPEWSAMAGLVAREAGALRTAAAALAARMRGAGLRGEWEAAARAAPCVHEQRLHLRARTLIERLRESWQHLVRDRATRALTYNDEQFHVLERITVGEAGRRARALLLRAAPMARARADALHDWYQVAQTVWLQTCILDKDAAGAELKLLALAARLQDAELHARHQLQDQLNSSKLVQQTEMAQEQRSTQKGPGGAGAGRERGSGWGRRARACALCCTRRTRWRPPPPPTRRCWRSWRASPGTCSPSARPPPPHGTTATGTPGTTCDVEVHRECNGNFADGVVAERDVHLASDCTDTASACSGSSAPPSPASAAPTVVYESGSSRDASDLQEDPLKDKTKKSTCAVA